MRILYHHRTLGDGAEGIHIREVVEALRSLGHEVRVVSLVGEQLPDNARPSIDPDQPPTAMPYPNKNLPPSSQRKWAKIGNYLPGVSYELAEIAYNVVGGRMVRRAIHDFKPDLIYDRYNTFCTAAVNAARRAGIPVYVEVNAPLAYERAAYERRPLRLRRLAQWYEHRICQRANHLFAVSTPLKEFLVSERGVPRSRITLLSNGANPQRFAPTQEGSRCKIQLGVGGRTVIGFVGILRPWHGLDFLLAAFAGLATRWPEIHLLIVGDGTIEDSLKSQAATLGVADRVTFTGRVPHGGIRDYLAAMDIAVSPRATFYASPMKLLEYMAMGIATVAPDMANIRDIISDGENGVLFQPENGPSLERVLESLLRNPILATELGTQARRTIEATRNWTTIAQQIVDRKIVDARLGG